MAAMNKQQAMAAKKRSYGERTTSYGANPGEVTAGRPGSDFYFDPDTNTWQLKPEAQGNDINAYMDDILGTAGMKDAGTQSQNNQPGSGGGGKAEEGPGEAEGDGDQDDQAIVEDATQLGIPLGVIAGGLLGAGAALIARKLMKARSGNAASSAASAPSAMAGAPKAANNVVPMPVDPQKMAGADQMIDGTFDDVLGLPPPNKMLPPPDATMTPDQAAPAPTPPPVDDPNLYRTGDSPRTDVGQGYPTPDVAADPVAETIQNVDGGSEAKLVDPLEEALANRIAEILAKQGNYNPPAISPATKGVNVAIMKRVRAILAGMRP